MVRPTSLSVIGTGLEIGVTLQLNKVKGISTIELRHLNDIPFLENEIDDKNFIEKIP